MPSDRLSSQLLVLALLVLKIQNFSLIFVIIVMVNYDHFAKSISEVILLWLLFTAGTYAPLFEHHMKFFSS